METRKIKMTAIALNYSKSLIEGFLAVLKIVLNGAKKTLQGIMVGWMIARQTQANTHIARMLIESGEYKSGDHNYYTLLADLNRKTIDNIHKEFGRD